MLWQCWRAYGADAEECCLPAEFMQVNIYSAAGEMQVMGTLRFMNLDDGSLISNSTIKYTRIYSSDMFASQIQC